MKLSKVLLLIITQHMLVHGAAVTYDFSGGRFGDELVSYSHARWVSYKYDIPLIYKPFSYSDQLVLHTLHERYKRKKVARRFNEEIAWPRVGVKVDLNSLIDPKKNILYTIPYFPESPFELTQGKWHFDIDWDDRDFLEIIRSEIASLKKIQQLNLPQNRFCLAVHMRKGGGVKYDILLQDTLVRDPEQEYADEVWPHKFPPFEYYKQQIIYVSELLHDQPLYVHIFTDDRDPAGLIEQCKKAIHKPNITYGSRISDNRHDANVLDDFFALTQFDGLIRGDSNFSLMAAKLTDYAIEISPKSSRWEGHKLIITDVYKKGSLAEHVLIVQPFQVLQLHHCC